MRRLCRLFFIVTLLTVAAFAQNVTVYQTTSDLSQKLQSQPTLSFSGSGTASQTINIDDTKTYQQIDGFGASFTDSSAWLVYNKLSTDQRNDLMQRLFDRNNGIGLSFLRQPMGSSDLARTFYSYDDMPSGQTDPTLAHFSVDHDREYIIPVLKQALALNSDLKIMANPWSPPAWMKTNNSMIGNTGMEGHLKTDAYDPLAKYFVKYIQAYQVEGLPTYAISMQNEPLYTPGDYAGMAMSVSEQVNFLKNNLGPALKTAGLSPKVMVYDHNWDRADYAKAVLSDPGAYAVAAGSAWHHYAGDPGAMTGIHDAFPDKEIWETEASGGTWQSGNIFAQEAKELIDTMRNWAKSYVLWNMVLDQDNGPYVGGCKTCRGVATVNWDKTGAGGPSSFKEELDYYVLGQASKFLKAGAFHIASDQATAVGIHDVAFRNPDGSIVVYALNDSSTDQTFNVKFAGKYVTYTLKAGAVATFLWNPTPAPVVTVSSQPNGMLVTAGQSASLDLTLQSLNGAATTVSLSCTGAPDKATCDVNPSSITVPANGAAISKVTITTTAPKVTTASASPSKGTTGLAFAAVPMFGLLFLGGNRKRNLIVAALLLCTFSLYGCGGGGGGGSSVVPPPPPTTVTVPGTPAGNYTLAVVATTDTGAPVTTTVAVRVN
jgi:glucosylceramidase